MVLYRIPFTIYPGGESSRDSAHTPGSIPGYSHFSPSGGAGFCIGTFPNFFCDNQCQSPDGSGQAVDRIGGGGDPFSVFHVPCSAFGLFQSPSHLILNSHRDFLRVIPTPASAFCLIRGHRPFLRLRSGGRVPSGAGQGPVSIVGHLCGVLHGPPAVPVASLFF